MAATVFDETRAELGEGPLWHPELGALYWFDILGRTLYRRYGTERQSWTFDRCASAAGWVDRELLLVATEGRLVVLNTETGSESVAAPLPTSDGAYRTNDGRADPQGGFWIGTMSKTAASGEGRIYRYCKGVVRLLVDRITIPNAICFSPDGRRAHYADSADGRVMQIRLDDDGWPVGDPSVYLDFRGTGLIPDGSVIDSGGDFWCAQWGSSRVARYRPDGMFVEAIQVDAPHTSCPAFGGADFSTLFVTTALEHMNEAERSAAPLSGAVFTADTNVKGQPEHRVEV